MQRYLDLFYSSSKVVKWGGCCIGLAVLGVASGCSQAVPPTEPLRRSVKIEAVKESQDREVSFTGTVRERQRAELAFESGGRIARISVDVGDAVKKGQVLASLDLETTQLRLQQAQAKVESNLSQAAERKSNFVRQQRLFEAGSVSQGMVEVANVSYQQAKAEQRQAEADLARVRHDLDRGKLIAPFAGRVVARHVNQYAELASGQVALELESVDDQQVVAALPAEQAALVKPGDTAFAYPPDSSDAPIDLVLEGISSRSENGVMRTCIYRVREPSAVLASGSTVMVQRKIHTPSHLTVPEKALWIGAGSSYVFVYEPTQEKVLKRVVLIKGVEQGRALVESGVALGDWVVTAGASFISDGQTVSVFKPATRLAGN